LAIKVEGMEVRSGATLSDESKKAAYGGRLFRSPSDLAGFGK
jgi:hypothetical protein